MDTNIALVDYALYLKKEQVLVLSDTHIGEEEALHRKGVLIPKTQYKDIVRRLGNIFETVPVSTVVFNGDVKHVFGKNLNTEWREIFHLIDFLSAQNKEIVFVCGNHDKGLRPILKKKEISLVENYSISSYLCIHGDRLEKEISPKITTLIMGHEHPCVGLRNGARMEKFKCFLFGSYEKKKLIVLPSFSTLSEGTDLLTYEPHSPYLKKNFEQCEVVIPNPVTNEGKHFGTIGELLELHDSE